jgi:hypothetical protein
MTHIGQLFIFAFSDGRRIPVMQAATLVMALLLPRFTVEAHFCCLMETAVDFKIFNGKHRSHLHSCIFGIMAFSRYK